MEEQELFERAPVNKVYFKFALPLVSSMVLSLFYNMVDTFFIAQTQNTNLVAGVSLCAPVFIIMIAIGDIFGLGGSSVISRLLGEKRDEEGKRVSGFCFYAAIIVGIFITIFMLVFQNPVLRMLGVEEATKPYALQYYFYLAIGAPIFIVNYSPSNMLRAEGLAVESMIGTMSGTIVNIILDPIFIFKLNMGAAGAAIATVLGTLCSDIVLIYFVLKRSHKLTVSCKNIRITRRILGSIMAIGIPASVTNFMQSFGIALVNRSLVVYGTDKVAAMGIAMKVNMIIMLVLIGLSFGGQPLIGYNYGAKNMSRMRQVISFSLKFEIGLAIAAGIILALSAPYILPIFMEEEAIVTAGTLMMRCQLVTMPFVAVVLIFTVVFQAAGKAVSAFVLSFSRQGIVLAMSMFVLSRLFGYYGVICAQALADAVTAVIAIILYMYLRKTELKPLQ